MTNKRSAIRKARILIRQIQVLLRVLVTSNTLNSIYGKSIRHDQFDEDALEESRVLVDVRHGLEVLYSE